MGAKGGWWSRGVRQVVGVTSGLFSIGVLLAAFLVVKPADSLPPVPLEQLGLVRDHAALAEPVVAASVPFKIVGADNEDNTGKNIRLWESVLKVRGQHLRNYPQQIGDCVSFGVKNCIEYLQCVQIARGNLDGADDDGMGGTKTFRPVFPPYIYGTSRHQIGGDKIRGDGSVGAWAAEASSVYGVLNSDHGNCPEYSAKVASEWGRVGPPAWALEAGKRRLVKTVSPVKSARQACDSVCNGYPVSIASSFGTTAIRQQDGRQVARWNTTWYHQMCLVGYDGTSASGKRYFYCLNSWGETSHPSPLQGEPPGGFWLTWEDVEKITVQGDSWAFSSFDGFPAQAIDFSVFGAADGPQVPNGVRAGQGGGEMRVGVLGTIELGHEWFMPLLGMAVLLAAVAMASLWGNGRRRAVMAGLLAVVAVLQAGATVEANDRGQNKTGTVPLIVDQSAANPAGTQAASQAEVESDEDPMNFTAFGVERPIVAATRPRMNSNHATSISTTKATSPATKETAKTIPPDGSFVRIQAVKFHAFGVEQGDNDHTSKSTGRSVSFKAWGCDLCEDEDPAGLSLQQTGSSKRQPQCLVFWMESCQPCDASKKYLKEKIVPLGWTVSDSEDADFRLIDQAKFPELVERYQIEVAPTMVFVDREGKESSRQSRIVGFSGPVNVTSELVRLRKAK